MKTNEFVAEYDVANYIHNEIEFFKKDKQEFCVSILWDEEREPESITDDEIEEHFWGDYYMGELHWEDFQYRLEVEFTKHIGKDVYVEGRNMGWRNRTGHKEFTINETLDVFREEPLPENHVLWGHPKITVTPHIASETRPETASKVIATNIDRFEKGLPLLNQVDFKAGY